MTTDTREEAKVVGTRVQFEAGDNVWNKLKDVGNHSGPWVVAEDDGGEQVRLYNPSGEEKTFPALLLTTKAPTTTKEPKEFPKIPTWLYVAILLIGVGAASGYVLSGGSFKVTWGSGFAAFCAVTIQRLCVHFG